MAQGQVRLGCFASEEEGIKYAYEHLTYVPEKHLVCICGRPSWMEDETRRGRCLVWGEYIKNPDDGKIILKGRLDAACKNAGRRNVVKMSPIEMGNKYSHDPAWAAWFEGKRGTADVAIGALALQDDGVTPAVAVQPAQGTEVKLVNVDRGEKKARGQHVIYTEASYARNHGGRTYEADGHKLQLMTEKDGSKTNRIVVWEGEDDVWTLNRLSLSDLESGTMLASSSTALDDSEVAEQYLNAVPDMIEDVVSPVLADASSGSGAASSGAAGSGGRANASNAAGLRVLVFQQNTPNARIIAT